jgi:hypothetical protein
MGTKREAKRISSGQSTTPKKPGEKYTKAEKKATEKKSKGRRRTDKYAAPEMASSQKTVITGAPRGPRAPLAV